MVPVSQRCMVEVAELMAIGRFEKQAIPTISGALHGIVVDRSGMTGNLALQPA